MRCYGASSRGAGGGWGGEGGWGGRRRGSGRWATPPGSGAAPRRGPPDPELARIATSIAVEPLPPARVQRWVAHRAGQLKLDLEPDAADLLVQTVGGDLGALGGELEKLAALTAGRSGEGGGAATRDDVAALVGARPGETLQDLIDAALERRAAAAGRLIEPVLEQAGMTGVRILAALGTALVGTALARAQLDRGPSPGPLARA